MKLQKTILAALMLGSLALAASAQTTPIITTNFVTITVIVTNVVTVTNFVTAVPETPAPAPAPAADTAKLPPAEPKYPWESALTAGLTLTRGNSHTLLYSADLKSTKKTPENEYNLGSGGAFGSSDGKDSVNTYGGFAQWNRLFSERFYGYLRGEAKRDVIADLDYRFNVGPGVGYYFVKEKATTLSGEAGGGYQYEHLGNEYNSFMTARLAEKFEHKFGDRARIWQNVEILPQVDKLQNYTVNFEIGAEASMTKTISLNVTLKDTYQSEPAAGRYRNDIKLISGLSYKF